MNYTKELETTYKILRRYLHCYGFGNHSNKKNKETEQANNEQATKNTKTKFVLAFFEGISAVCIIGKKCHT